MRTNLSTTIQGIITQSKSTAPQQQKEERENKFIRPVIKNEQFKLILNNYRKHIAEYNKPINEYNKPLRELNQKVTHPPHDLVMKVRAFNKRTSKMDIETFNKEAMIFNNKEGYHISYKYKATVKPNSIQFFEAILHMYMTQLATRNEISKKVNKNYKSSLPRVSVNSHYVTTQMRAGVLNLDVSTRTVRNHINRLEEAGVLLEREYRGTKSPLTFKINPKLLVILDDATRKNLTAENQPLTSLKRKELQHIKVSTRDINNNKKKENINNSLDKDFAAQSLKDLFYKSTKPQLGDKQGEKQKIAQKSSAKILRFLDRPNILAEKLSQGVYNQYAPLKTSDLRKLITSPDLTDEDYRELVIQDFIKSSASLWADNQASVGSWYNALVHIYNRYGTTNFKGKAMSRNKMYSWLMQMRYRLSYAMNWFKKREWDGVWYPNIYFDPLRTLPSDVCFGYTKKVWSQKLKKQQDVATARRKEAAAAARRKEALSAHRKAMRRLDQYIYRYLDHSITLENLTMALTTMPESVQEKFSERLDTLRTRKMKKDE